MPHERSQLAVPDPCDGSDLGKVAGTGERPER